jgi:hypothetical protein
MSPTPAAVTDLQILKCAGDVEHLSHVVPLDSCEVSNSQRSVKCYDVTDSRGFL